MMFLIRRNTNVVFLFPLLRKSKLDGFAQRIFFYIFQYDWWSQEHTIGTPVLIYQKAFLKVKVFKIWTIHTIKFGSTCTLTKAKNKKLS